jgi:pyroglutamyl-peptidase
MKPDVLLTGFEAFGGDARNPSSEACALLDGAMVRGHRLRILCLPTAFNAAALQLLREIARDPPGLVIATGVAGGRSEITPERFALNFADARIPDNRRRQPRERTIVRGAPLAYMSTLPVTRIVEKLRDAGIPAAASLSAGAFVCNELFFRLRHALEGSKVRAGFIHLPYASEHVVDRPGVPSLPLATLAAGLRIAVEASLSGSNPSQ